MYRALLLLCAALLCVSSAVAQLTEPATAPAADGAALAPPLSAVYNCAALMDCGACVSATFDWTDLRDSAAGGASTGQAAPPALQSNKPCGWCMSSWKCLNGDVNGPSAPLECPSVMDKCDSSAHWSFEDCAYSAHCGGHYCNVAQSCKRHTADDGSETTFECVISTGVLVGSIVGSVLLCSLLVTCAVCYRRRRLARESGFATFSQPYVSQTVAHEHAYHQYA